MTWHPYSWYALALLALLPLVGWRLLARRKQSAVRYSSTAVLQAIKPSLKSRLTGLVPALRLAALAVLIIALARPQKGDEQTSVTMEGVAIQLLVDRSGSMRSLDFKIDDKPVNRLAAVHKVVHDFVRGIGGLSGRDNDLIGMIAFSRFPDSRCPLTLDHNYLLETLKQVKPAAPSDDGTAIGEALALGVEHLRDLDRTRDAARRIKSKIIILLTDGQNNSGDIEPLKAADLAAKFGFKVYAIGVGTKGVAPYPLINPQTGQDLVGADGKVITQPLEADLDEGTLKKIAEKTGGKYYRATDSESLNAIYKDIDQLEKTKTEQKIFTDYKELAVEPVKVAGFTLPPLLWCAFALLGLEVLLSNTWFRKVT